MTFLQFCTAMLLGSALILGMARFLLGPTAVDRVVSGDTLSVIVTAGLVALAAWMESSLYLDVALVYGALAFAGVVAIARAIEKGAGGK